VFHYGRNVSSDAWSSSNGIAVREGSPLFTDKALVAGEAIGYSTYISLLLFAGSFGNYATKLVLKES
jgi:hypothetical protein